MVLEYHAKSMDVSSDPGVMETCVQSVLSPFSQLFVFQLVNASPYAFAASVLPSGAAPANARALGAIINVAARKAVKILFLFFILIFLRVVMICINRRDYNARL